ncbi:nucleoside diphosphate kinase regulator [Phenylobacterium sp.]|jgi:regulator of nucleoside diphosphate kinase|uniref:nucleoside diphosphate kinase regulator n=1 Tax=Phenylobacterium sp. TaxID=1871053 RepID=UPI000C98E6A4|nr:nucleoside diphosphate kinase regulator [Phenylobacterium sp.]MAK82777.1 transcription elongation factor GreAB [Phenylobacterium sp.]|tara:strand:- start:8698 stop:9123 length:426 start_codon:yes stop_codon:yes gene_type:complete
MTARAAAASRPTIILTETDADRITDLALGAMQRAPEVARLLLEEVERAEVRPHGEMPVDVVSMGARVEFVDQAHGEARAVTLVYPAEADIAAGRISILSPVGAGLLGLRPGQSIQWPDRDGRERALRVVSVRPAAGPADPA